MGLFLEMFNSGSRGVLCKTWIQKILHTNNVKKMQKFFSGQNCNYPVSQPKSIQRTELRLNTLSPGAGGMIHEDAQSHSDLEHLHLFFFFHWRDKIVFARKGQNKSELKMDVEETVTFEFLN